MPLALPKVRDDLIFSPDYEAPGYTFVKCPVRNDFYRYNDIQIFLMRAMDGDTPPSQLAELVEEEWEIEMEEAQILRFVDRLAEAFLLDISSYRADDVATCKEIKKRLKKAGFNYRVKARDAANPEANLFSQGMQHATGDNPLHAVSYFKAILEINPDNQRARLVLDCINEAFLNMRRKDMAHGAKSIRLVNPEPFLQRLDNLLGNFVFSGFGVFIITALILIQIPMAADIVSMPEFRPSEFGLADGISFGLVFITIMLIHELGHAWASKHYGGHPNELGLQLILGILPAAYCDASDTYLFKHTRHKIICFMAGVPAQLLCSTVLFFGMLVTDPSSRGWIGVGVGALLSSVTAYQNINPLLPFDGYYALSAHWKILNLRERAFQHTWRTLGKHIFGVEIEDSQRTSPQDSRRMLLFGVLAILYTVAFVTIFMLNIAVPFAIENLGVAGAVLVFFFFYGQFQKIFWLILTPFFSFLRQHKRTVFTPIRSGAYLIVLAGIVWILSWPSELRIIGRFEVEPAQLASIAASEGGTVSEVLVKEGEKVSKGQPMFRLYSQSLDQEVALAKFDLAVSELQLSMLEAGARPEKIALAMAKHKANRARSLAMSTKVQQAKSLAALNVGSSANILKARKEAVSATGQNQISSAELELMRAGSSILEKKAAKADVDKKTAELAALERRVSNLVIRADIDGYVVTQRLGELYSRRVEQGDELCRIADTTAWIATISPGIAEPLDGIEVGSRVVLKSFGAPNLKIHTSVEALLPPNSDKVAIMVRTKPIDQPLWRLGFTGYARIYGAPRSIAYEWIALPIVQFYNTKLEPVFKKL